MGDLVHVFEYWEEEHRRHKVECYFLARLEVGELDTSWKDMDGPVSHIRFFGPEEMTSAKVYPEFLLEGAWNRPGLGQGVYQGFER